MVIMDVCPVVIVNYFSQCTAGHFGIDYNCLQKYEHQYLMLYLML